MGVVLPDPARFASFLLAVSMRGAPASDRVIWNSVTISSIKAGNGWQVSYIIKCKKVCLWVFPTMGVPKNGRFIGETPLEMDDVQEQPKERLNYIYIYVHMYICVYMYVYVYI